MININGKRCLITLDEPFVAPDGFEYRSIYGTVYVHKAEDVLGMISRGHANFVLRVCEGEDNDNGILLAGCRANYICPMPTIPPYWNTRLIPVRIKQDQVEKTVDLWIGYIYVVKDDKKN
jgi:hypothetical protein